MDKQNTISILSMQRVVNYGSVLQAYSLRQLIQEQTGAHVNFLDIDESTCLRSERTVKEAQDYEEPASYPKGILQRGKRYVISKLSAHNKRLIRRFMKEELKLDEEATADPTCVVIGSDEVFNHRSGVCLQLHGDVKGAKKIISYGASCGSAMAEDILPEDRETVRKTLENVERISVRDEATRQYILALTGRETEHHLDPVLMGSLHERDPHPVRLKNYLLVYAYGHRIRTAEEIEAIQTFAKDRKLKTVAMGGSQFWCDRYIPASPMRMLDYFHHADYVVTDTFHGAVFSVIHRKPFAVLSRKTNAGKITGLLDDLNLRERLVQRPAELEKVLTTEIPYGQVDDLLEKERIRTKTYLKECLGDGC